MDLTKNISANLSAWMNSNPNLDTVKKVSDRSGVGFGTVRRTKNGDGNPTIKNLGDIARVFGRDVADLIAETPNGTTVFEAKEHAPAPYNQDLSELIGYLKELDAQDLEIYTQEIKLAALKARKKRRDMEDRLPTSGQGDPPPVVRRTA